MHENPDDRWPSELRLMENGRLLRISFGSGVTYDLSAEYLRVMSPSAELQGHRPEERVTIGGKRHCCIIGIEPVGSYAVRFTFDDMHATGLFTWAYLYELGSRACREMGILRGGAQSQGAQPRQGGTGITLRKASRHKANTNRITYRFVPIEVQSSTAHGGATVRGSLPEVRSGRRGQSIRSELSWTA